MPEEKKIPSWADARITVNMPLDLIVNFLNVLNQRLVTIESVVTVQGPDGKMISLSDLYALQSEEEAKRMAQENQTEPENQEQPKGE